MMVHNKGQRIGIPRSQRTGKEFPCEVCGEIQYRRPADVKRIEAGKQKVFCGHAHYRKDRRKGKWFTCMLDGCENQIYQRPAKTKQIEAGECKVFCCCAHSHRFPRPRPRGSGIQKTGKEFQCMNKDCDTVIYRKPADVRRIEVEEQKVFCSSVCANTYMDHIHGRIGGASATVIRRKRRKQGLGPGNGKVPTFYNLSTKIVDADTNDMEALWNKQKGICPICKKSLEGQSAQGWPPSPDAIDPFLEPESHILANTWILCWECNLHKWDHSLEAILDWVHIVARANPL